MRYYFLKDFSDPPILYSKSAGGKGLAIAQKYSFLRCKIRVQCNYVM